MSKIHEYTAADIVNLSDMVIIDIENGGNYVNKSATVGKVNEAMQLSKLSDTEINNPVAGQVLMFNQSGDIINGTVATFVEVSGTLTTGSTSITLSDNAITTSSTVDVYTDGDVDYNSVTISTGSVTITFDEQASDMGVKVRVS